MTKPTKSDPVKQVEDFVGSLFANVALDAAASSNPWLPLYVIGNGAVEATEVWKIPSDLIIRAVWVDVNGALMSKNANLTLANYVSTEGLRFDFHRFGNANQFQIVNWKVFGGDTVYFRMPTGARMMVLYELLT